MTNPRLQIRKTEIEWERLSVILKPTKHENPKSYIVSECRNLSRIYNQSPENVMKMFGGEMQKRVFCLDDETTKCLQKISRSTGKPISSIIDDLFISPLLIIGSPESTSIRQRLLLL